MHSLISVLLFFLTELLNRCLTKFHFIFYKLNVSK